MLVYNMDNSRAEQAKTVISDIRTYNILTRNKNYKERLFEAYEYIKERDFDTYEKFSTATDNKVGAFTYTEITIFDRLEDKEYRDVIATAPFLMDDITKKAIDNPQYGDTLASWGTLGSTPFRQKLIDRGDIIHGLTDQEVQRKFSR